MRTQGSTEALRPEHVTVQAKPGDAGAPEDVDTSGKNKVIPRGDSGKQLRASKQKLKGLTLVVGQVQVPNKLTI